MEFSMNIKPTLAKGRDLRLDLFRGVANWAIFLDHIPNNAVNWITTRNYGFSDAADLFVFISGYTAAFVYARMMIQRGFIVGVTRLFKRVWQLYVAHVLLFVIYVASIGWVALRYSDPQIINEFNITELVDSPIQTISQGLLLRFKPLNLDVLPLYIVLMACFGPVLWLLLRKPNLTMAGSLLLYFAARHFGWNLRGPGCDPRAIPALDGRALSGFRFPDDAGGPLSRIRSAVSDLVGGHLQPERQDQPRALSLPAFRGAGFSRHPFRPQGLAGPAMEDIRSPHQVRPAIAAGFLRRRLPVLRRAFYSDDELRHALEPDLGQHDGARDHDRGCRLWKLVEAAGQAACRSATREN